MATVSTRAEELSQTWDRPPGIIGWLSQVNHKAIGVRYFVTSFVFFALAGISALIMRLQLSMPELRIVNADTYNQLFTTHGTTMMFLFAVPMMEAIGMYIVPLMIGARDMAFPRLNAFGYWIFLIAGTTLWVSLFTGNAPDAGWFNYVPLSGPDASPGMGVDVWTTAITFIEIAALVAAVELIVTIFKMRAPGMSLNRMPVFVWAILVMAFMITFAMPPVMLASVMLMLDRMIGTGFFDVAMGGDPLLWQHLFWIFGHPEVYIILIPGLGMVSAIVAAFARRPNAAYSLLTASFVGVGFLSFGLWVHHMFAAGLPWMSLSFFEAASMAIAIPSGIAIFSWIATLWGTRPKLQTPFLYILGFFFIFIMGGMTGVMIASIPFNLAVHDTYFIVAHFHYVLIGSGVFPMVGAAYFWYPKITGKMMHEGLGKISFWTTFIGFNLAFFPQHILGFFGMPRQIYTYRDGLGWGEWNMASTVGAYLLGLGFLMTLVNMITSARRGESAGKNPWGAGTLEWATESPAPPYNFERLPMVRARYPLWKDGEIGPADPENNAVREITDEVMVENTSRRESPGTRMLDSRLERVAVVASPSIWPMFAAFSVAVIVIGIMFTFWAVPVGIVLAYASLIGWLWPRKKEWAI